MHLENNKRVIYDAVIFPAIIHKHKKTKDLHIMVIAINTNKINNNIKYLRQKRAVVTNDPHETVQQMDMREVLSHQLRAPD